MAKALVEAITEEVIAIGAIIVIRAIINEEVHCCLNNYHSYTFLAAIVEEGHSMG